MKFVLFINLKILTKFCNFFHAQLSWARSAELSKKKVLNFWYFYFYDQVKSHAQLSWAWKKFYNLGAWLLNFVGLCCPCCPPCVAACVRASVWGVTLAFLVAILHFPHSSSSSCSSATSTTTSTTTTTITTTIITTTTTTTTTSLLHCNHQHLDFIPTSRAYLEIRRRASFFYFIGLLLFMPSFVRFPKSEEFASCLFFIHSYRA